MGKKSRKSKNTNTTIEINSEESAIDYLDNLLKKWMKNGNIGYTNYIVGISYIPEKFRTANVIKYVLSHFGNISKQSSLFPERSITEEVLIQTLLFDPSILNPILSSIIVEKDNELKKSEDIEAEKIKLTPIGLVRSRLDEIKNKKPTISQDRLTIPVLVAYEIGNTRNNGNYQPFNMFGVPPISNTIDLLEMYLDYCHDEKVKKNVYQIADEVEKEIEEKNLGYAFSSLDWLNYKSIMDRKGVCLQQISDLIQTKSKESRAPQVEDIEKSEPYKIKYKKVKINQGKKLAILIGGHSDSGKTTLSRVLKNRFTQAKAFDSNDLMGDLNPLRSSIDFCSLPSERIDSKDDVVIYSDPQILSVDSGDAIDIMEAMGDPEIVSILIKPKDDCIEKMISNAKMNWKDRSERLIDEVNEYTKDYADSADLILENDFSKGGITKLADEVIDYIMREYPGLLSVVEYGERPDASDFVQAIGIDRINSGAKRAEKTLFKEVEFGEGPEQ